MQEPGVSSIVSVRLRGGQQVDETVVPDDAIAGEIGGEEVDEDSAAEPSPA
jgi:hypothetical protein